MGTAQAALEDDTTSFYEVCEQAGTTGPRLMCGKGPV